MSVADGVFGAAYDLWYDRPEQDTRWQMAEMRRVLDWFNRHLDAPDRLDYRAGRHSWLEGYCWFRDGATAHVRQGRYLAFLVEDLGHPIVERRSRDPGRILWSDAAQVVVLHGA